VLSRLRALDPFLERWVLRDAYGTIFSRHGLEVQERSLLTGLILGIQRLDRQMASHIRGTLRLGVPSSEVLRWIRVAERLSGASLENARSSTKRFAR
jgi:alkylhydroperoxidase/carboxymuconolactone decarboxylase family protein YurZ